MSAVKQADTAATPPRRGCWRSCRGSPPTRGHARRGGEHFGVPGRPAPGRPLAAHRAGRPAAADDLVDIQFWDGTAASPCSTRRRSTGRCACRPTRPACCSSRLRVLAQVPGRTTAAPCRAPPAKLEAAAGGPGGRRRRDPWPWTWAPATPPSPGRQPGPGRGPPPAPALRRVLDERTERDVDPDARAHPRRPHLPRGVVPRAEAGAHLPARPDRAAAEVLDVARGGPRGRRPGRPRAGVLRRRAPGRLALARRPPGSPEENPVDSVAPTSPDGRLRVAAGGRRALARAAASCAPGSRRRSWTARRRRGRPAAERPGRAGGVPRLIPRPAAAS